MQLDSLMEIILFVVSICCILYCLVDPVGIGKFDIFWEFCVCLLFCFLCG